MTGRIVVGIDGSQQSGNALEWAVARARLGGEHLELVNAYTIVPDLDFYGYHHHAAPQQVDWWREFSEEVLAAAAARVHELAPDLTSKQTSEIGPPAQVLAALSEGADLLVVGRRGVGSVAGPTRGTCPGPCTGSMGVSPLFQLASVDQSPLVGRTHSAGTRWSSRNSMPPLATSKSRLLPALL